MCLPTSFASTTSRFSNPGPRSGVLSQDSRACCEQQLLLLASPIRRYVVLLDESCPANPTALLVAAVAVATVPADTVQSLLHDEARPLAIAVRHRTGGEEAMVGEGGERE